MRSSHLHSLMVQGSSAVVGMVVFMMYARWLSPGQMGSLVLFITTFTILDMLRSGFVQSALVKYYNHVTTSNGPRNVAAASFALTVLFSITTVGIVLLSGLLVGHRFPESEQVMYFVIWPILQAVSIPGQWFSWMGQARSRFDRVLLYRLSGSLSILLGMIALVASDSMGVIQAAWILCMGAAASSLLVMLLGWVRPGVRTHFHWSWVKRLFRFGRFSVLTNLGASLLKSADTYLIGAVLNLEAVAIYALAQKVIDLLDLPLRAFSSSLYPIVARCAAQGDGRRIGRVLERAATGLSLMLLLPAALVFVFAPALVQWIGGAGFESSIWVVRVFVISSLLLPIDRLMGLTLDGLNLPRINMQKVLLMLVLNIVGDLLVLLFWPQLWAVALVTVLMSAAGIFYGYRQLLPHVEFSFRRAMGFVPMWFRPAYVRTHILKSSSKVSSVATA